MVKNYFSVDYHWYRSRYTALTILLLPVSWLFRLIILIRTQLYHCHIKKSVRVPVPVLVVGNLTVGGTGKTPFVIWLANFLQQQGYSPGIVSRGEGGKKNNQPCPVNKRSLPVDVGDEAILLMKRTQCPMVVGRNRVAAVKKLLNENKCNIIISDDGLQHYRLSRDFEIVIVDGQRKFGNKQLLPAGPLREPLSRLVRADMVIVNGKHEQGNNMELWGEELVSLADQAYTQKLADFPYKTVHAIVGIGNPQRFFSLLRENKLNVIEHVFPDHYLYQAEDIHFADDLPVLMTEKDAVKCEKFATSRHWYLPVTARVSKEVEDKISKKLKEGS